MAPNYKIFMKLLKAGNAGLAEHSRRQHPVLCCVQDGMSWTLCNGGNHTLSVVVCPRQIEKPGVEFTDGKDFGYWQDNREVVDRAERVSAVACR